MRNQVWLSFRPHYTIFKSEVLIPPGTKVKLTIERAQRDPKEMSLIWRAPKQGGAGAAANNYYRNEHPANLSVSWAIERFFVDIMTYRLNGPTSSGILSELESKSMVYPFDLYSVRRAIVNTNNSAITTIEVWNGRIPDKFILKFVDTKIWDAEADDAVQPWVCSTFPRKTDGTVYMTEADIRYNDVSLWQEPLRFDFANTAAGGVLAASTDTMKSRGAQVWRQGHRAAYGRSMKRLEDQFRYFLGVKENVELPLTREDLANGQMIFAINMDPSGGPYDASLGRWGTIKFHMRLNMAGFEAADNLSLLFIGYTPRHILQGFTNVTASTFSGGLNQQ